MTRRRPAATVWLAVVVVVVVVTSTANGQMPILPGVGLHHVLAAHSDAVSAAANAIAGAEPGLVGTAPPSATMTNPNAPAGATPAPAPAPGTVINYDNEPINECSHERSRKVRAILRDVRNNETLRSSSSSRCRYSDLCVIGIGCVVCMCVACIYSIGRGSVYAACGLCPAA